MAKSKFEIRQLKVHVVERDSTFDAIIRQSERSDLELRTSFGFSTLFLLLSAMVGHAAGNSNAADEMQELLPPYPEIPPTFWEQNGTWIVLAALGGVLLLAITIRMWNRPRPRPIAPPEETARRNLEELARLPEDGKVLARISHSLKEYFMAAFQLDHGELTTAEFRSSLSRSNRVEPDLANEVGKFLVRCDERKFAPGILATGPGAARRAIELVELAEQGRARARHETQESGTAMNAART